MNQTLPIIGIRLGELRRLRRKTQRGLAATLQTLNAPVTKDVIANWETGRTDIPAQFIPLLAYVLQAEVTDFVPTLSRHLVNKLVHGRIAAGSEGFPNS